MASSLQGCSLAPLSEAKGRGPKRPLRHVIDTLKRTKNVVSAGKGCSSSQVWERDPKFKAYRREEKKNQENVR